MPKNPSVEELNSEQLRLVQQIHGNLGVINRTLTEQIALHKGVQQQASGANADLSKQLKVTMEEVRKAGFHTVASTSTASTAIQNLGTTATTTGAAGVTTLESLQNMALDAISTVDNLHAAQRALAREHIEIRSQVQTQLGGIYGAGNKYNKYAQELLDTMNETHKFYRQTPEDLKVFGRNLNLVYHSAEDSRRAFVSFLDDLTMAPAVIKDIGAKQAIELQLLTDGLGYSTEQARVFVDRQLSLTGKANLDLLREAAAHSKAIEKQTGLSSKMIGAHITKIIGNVNTFGNVTVKEAARMSTELIQLGLNFQSIESMTNKFQGFESAAKNVSDLTASIGFNLDAMKMMELANVNQVEMLRYVRKEWVSQGKNIDNLNNAEKRILATRLGLADVGEVERLFDYDRELTSMNDLKDAQDAVGETDLRTAFQEVAKDMQTVEELSGKFSEAIMTHVVATMKDEFGPAMAKANESLIDLAGGFSDALGKTGVSALGSLSDVLMGILHLDPKRLLDLKTNMAGFGTGLKDMLSALTTGDIKGAFAALKGGFESLEIGKAITTGITSGFGAIKQYFDDLATQFDESMGKHLGKSESETGKKIRKGLTEALVKTGVEVKKFGDLTDKEAERIVSSYNKAGGTFSELTQLIGDGKSQMLLFGKMSVDQVKSLNDAEKKLIATKTMGQDAAAAWFKKYQEGGRSAIAATKQLHESIMKLGKDQMVQVSTIDEKVAETDQRLLISLADKTKGYGKLAAELRKQGIFYKDLNEADRQRIILSAGLRNEEQLKLAMSAKAMSTSEKLQQQKMKAQRYIQSLRASGKQFSDIVTNKTLVADIEKRFGLSKTALAAGLKAPSGEEGAPSPVASAMAIMEQEAFARYEKARAKEAAPAAPGKKQGKTAAAVSAGGATSSDVRRSMRVMEKQMKQIESMLEEVKGIREKPITIKLDFDGGKFVSTLVKTKGEGGEKIEYNTGPKK